MKALCIGHASYDITMPMESYPIENTKYRSKDVVECGGGPASNAAYLLAKWGIDTYFAGTVGNDDFGKRIKSEFKEVGVKTDYLELKKNGKTTMSFIVNNKQNGSRTIFTRMNDKEDLKVDITIKPDFILVDGEDPKVAKKVIKNNPEAISIIDAGRMKDEVVELAKLVDYVVCARVFAEEYTGVRVNVHDPDSMKQIFKKMNKDFKNVIITLEDKGALYQ